ncbi:hypothetical protein K7432_016744 [Basidiobolus ranarum]|uniref:Uncharacterized protein n=1 Tax=Basidiobolus ranarum TaxID=34480 RepID=A0ABR2VL84_9FUNG
MSAFITEPDVLSFFQVNWLLENRFSEQMQSTPNLGQNHSGRPYQIPSSWLTVEGRSGVHVGDPWSSFCCEWGDCHYRVSRFPYQAFVEVDTANVQQKYADGTLNVHLSNLVLHDQLFWVMPQCWAALFLHRFTSIGLDG